MRKFVRPFAIILLLALFSTLALGCETEPTIEDAPPSNTSTTSTTTTTTSVTDQKDSKEPLPITLEFETTVSYANWSDDPLIDSLALNYELTENKKDRIPIYRFENLEQLESFKTDFGEILCMNEDYNDIPSFEEATAKYDEAFFEENSLFLVYVTASSGSYRYQIVDVEFGDGSVCIRAKRMNNPQEVTWDMAGWFLTVAIPNEKLSDLTVFDAQLDDTAN